MALGGSLGPKKPRGEGDSDSIQGEREMTRKGFLGATGRGLGASTGMAWGLAGASHMTCGAILAAARGGAYIYVWFSLFSLSGLGERRPFLFLSFFLPWGLRTGEGESWEAIAWSSTLPRTLSITAGTFGIELVEVGRGEASRDWRASKSCGGGVGGGRDFSSATHDAKLARKWARSAASAHFVEQLRIQTSREGVKFRTRTNIPRDGIIRGGD